MYAIGVYAANVFVLNQDGNPANVGFFWSNVGLMGGGDTAPHNDPHLYDSTSAWGSFYRNSAPSAAATVSSTIHRDWP